MKEFVINQRIGINWFQLRSSSECLIYRGCFSVKILAYSIKRYCTAVKGCCTNYVNVDGEGGVFLQMIIVLHRGRGTVL